MNTFKQPTAVSKGWLSLWPVLALVAALVFAAPNAKAQSSSATVNGTVLDTSGAVVPDASVTLKNQASGDERTVISNGDGFFNFAAVPPGTYSVIVSRQGFKNWQAKDVNVNSGETRGVAGIKMQVGARSDTVVVEASDTQITPTDSGEKSFTIGQSIMQNVAIIGQNAAEFIKIMPGMAMGASATNQSSYAAANEGTGNGPVGSFSANGQRMAALDITSDGAHIVDPGCNCGQAENTNVDMTQEVTVQTSNFGADSAKGPVTINAVGKGGTQQFHGEAYVYARYYTLNANDWLNNNSVPLVARPDTKYLYPGVNFSGPVIIPKTGFNHNHDKLFFFFGTELYRQHVDNGTYHAVVPTGANAPATTMNMRAGDFTDNVYLSRLAGYANNNVPNNGGPNQNAYNHGTLNPGAGDPTGTGQALVDVYPLPTGDPMANQGFNYVSAATRFANMNQYRGRLDYSINNSTKLYVQYNHQNDNAEESLDTLWTGNAQSWVSPTTPGPSPIGELSDSEVVTANMTKVFTPTLTNEVIFNWVYLNLPNKFIDPAKVDRGTLGIDYNLLFPHTGIDPTKIIYPQMTGWGDGIANQLNTGFELDGGTVFAKKTLPSLADNVSKVWKTHTAKFGFYWERAWNSQPGNGSVNGSAVFSNWGGNDSGNAYANMLIGQMTEYSETNFNVIPAYRYLSADFFGQDSWKISRKVTIDLGLRLSHLGPWIDLTGYGFAAWYPSLYTAGKGGTAAGATFPGVEWHAANSSTPLSGSSSRLLFYNPRVGFAWDLVGTGNTIVRGGYGIYHYHDEQNVQGPAYSIVRGSFSTPSFCCSPTFSNPTGGATASLSIPSGVTTLDPNDSQQPQTQDWSFSVAQRTPWKSLVEVSYVGNRSDYLSNYNNSINTIDDLPVGALFSATTCAGDSITRTSNPQAVGDVACGWLPNCDPSATSGNSNCGATGGNFTNGPGTADVVPSGTLPYCTVDEQAQCARPYNAYGTIKIINHKMYSNYNALQVTWNKQQGHLIYMVNYTFSKALGVRGENGGTPGDPINVRNDYGTLPNDRTNIFNAAYVYQFPSINKGNAILKGAVNGWQLSGITQYQTGVDLQAAVTSNFGYSAYIPVGTSYLGSGPTQTAIKAANGNTIGTNDITLMPHLTCNPRKGLHANQFVNGSCFSPFVTVGSQGNYIFPTLHGPGFINSDLSAFKNFVFGASESKKLQFRFSGYNFLNHPVRSFNGNGDPSLTLNFDQNGAIQNVGGVPFGYAEYKVGHRIVQGEAKFSF